MRILTLTPEAYTKFKPAGRGIWFMSDKRNQIKCGDSSAIRLKRALWKVQASDQLLADEPYVFTNTRTLIEKHSDESETN